MSLRILLVHNRYQQPGGEDAVFEAEKKLLESHGHHVLAYERDNTEIEQYSLTEKLRLIKRCIWADDSYRDIKHLIHMHAPDIIHFHNTFPLVSPSVYWAAFEKNIPVVQTLHNYRLLCAAATFVRDGQICEKCLGKTPPWPGVVFGCYHDSHLQSAVILTMQTYHRIRKTWLNKINAFIALTNFSRSKFIQAGFPGEKLHVKPNFLEVTPPERKGIGKHALFLGRLTTEKGILTLLDAMADLQEIPLKIAGNGPLFDRVHQIIQERKLGNVEMLGHLTQSQVYDVLGDSRMVIIPSEWYEGFPRVIAEAFACSVPLVTSRLGSLAEIVEDGKTGLHFSTGSTGDLRKKVKKLWADLDLNVQLGKNANMEFNLRYSSSKNYHQLMQIYYSIISS